MASNQNKKRTGTLYRRWKGKDYSIDDTTVAGKGSIWLKYDLHGTTTRKSLKTSDLQAAEAERNRIMLPLQLADEAESSAQLELRAKQAKQKLEEAIKSESPPLPFADAWESYTGAAYAPDCGQETLNRYNSHFNALLKWLKTEQPEITKLNEITPAIALDFSAYIGRTFSPNTFNKYMNFLFSFYKTLKEPAAITDNPWHKDLIKRKRLTGKTNSKRELTLDELKSILEKAKGDEHMLHAIGIFTGMRRGDCATLKWSEIDLSRGIITRTPNKTKHTSGEKIKIGIPTYLHALLSTTPKTKRKGYVLPEIQQLYINDPTALSRQIQDLFKACDIETIRSGTGKGTKNRAVVEVGFHSYRHTYVSLHAMAGTPMAHVQKLAGHSNPAMTEHYTHISDAAVIQYAQALPNPFAASGIQDAEFEVIEDKALPAWAIDKLESMTSKNWKKIRDELVGG